MSLSLRILRRLKSIAVFRVSCHCRRRPCGLAQSLADGRCDLKGRTKVTEHRKRREIEQSLARGVPVRQIARDYGLSKSAVQRYKNHMAEQMTGAASAAETNADDLLARVRLLTLGKQVAE